MHLLSQESIRLIYLQQLKFCYNRVTVGQSRGTVKKSGERRRFPAKIVQQHSAGAHHFFLQSLFQRTSMLCQSHFRSIVPQFNNLNITTPLFMPRSTVSIKRTCTKTMEGKFQQTVQTQHEYNPKLLRCKSSRVLRSSWGDDDSSILKFLHAQLVLC